MNTRVLITILLLFSLGCTVFAADGDEEYIKVNRPEKQKGPTEVEFFVFVLDIDDIDGANQNFAANVFIYLKWMDPRLASDDGGVRSIPIEEVWNPRIIIANKQSLLRTSLPEIVRIHPDGKVSYRQRYVGPLSQPLRLSEFPFDKHCFAIQFLSPGYNPKEIRFIPGSPEDDQSIIGGAMYKTLSLTDWKIFQYKAEARPYIPAPNFEVAGFVFEFTAKRYVLYYIWQVIVPLVLIVIMSWGAFWIDPTHAGAQIGVATSSMLTLIAYRFMLGNLLPRLPYMTRMDYFTLGSTILVFLTFFEVILTTKLALSKRAVIGRKVDRLCRILFPATFAFWSAWSFVF